MIELLLEAERALNAGMIDQAERLYRQAAEADPRSSIAVVGLARVAIERSDDAGAYRLAKEALTIDPENVAAARIVGRIDEVYAHRGLPPPTAPEPEPTVEPAVAESGPVDPIGDDLVVDGTEPRPSPPAAPSPSLVDRLLRRSRP